MANDRSPSELTTDKLLADVPVVEGFKVIDRCVLYDKLGEGGMGAVYRGRHLSLDVDVAVKCLKKSLAEEDEQFVFRFEREAKIAARIRGENLVGVYDVNSRNGLHYIVMEYVHGESLAGRLRRKGPLSVAEAVLIIDRAARGLAKGHAEGIVHRDIKPENIMISTKGEVKVTDLGIARATHFADAVKTRSSSFMGTPHYAPPEQFMGADKVTPASDVYSIGGTLYTLLTGRLPFDGESLVEILYQVVNEEPAPVTEFRADVPEELLRILEKSMRKSAVERYADGEHLARALESFMRSHGIEGDLADDGAAERLEKRGAMSMPPAATLARIKRVVSEGDWPAAPATDVEGTAETVLDEKRDIAVMPVRTSKELMGHDRARIPIRPPETDIPETVPETPAPAIAVSTKNPTAFKKLRAIVMASIGLLLLAGGGRGVLAAFREVQIMGGVLCLGVAAVGLCLLLLSFVRIGRCPGCGAENYAVNEGTRSACVQCQKYLEGDKTSIWLTPEATIADAPTFAAELPESFYWPEGCCVCGRPATRTIEVSLKKEETAGKLAAAATGLAFGRIVVVTGADKTISVGVPHCASHMAGAALEDPAVGGIRILFRSYAFQRAFREINNAKV